MRAVAALVFVERVDQVLLVLSGDARHVIVGVGVGIAWDTVATMAGVDLGFAGVGIAGDRGGSGGQRRGRNGGQQARGGQRSFHSPSPHPDVPRAVQSALTKTEL